MSAGSCYSDVLVGNDDFFDGFPWVSCTRLQSESALTLKNLFRMLLARKHGITPGALAAALRAPGLAQAVPPLLSFQEICCILAGFECWRLGARTWVLNTGERLPGPKPRTKTHLEAESRVLGSALGGQWQAMAIVYKRRKIKILRCSSPTSGICWR